MDINSKNVAGIKTEVIRESGETVVFRGPVPDVIAYLQAETELARSTGVRILKEFESLGGIPMEFAKIHGCGRGHSLKLQLHKLMIDGIKYERVQKRMLA